MDPLNCIELTLKTPNQRFHDIRLKCNEDWTIKKLKEHLQDVYPSKPKWNSQKLIYLGKLLQDDHALLKEVFSTCARTLHIVCHETQMAESPKASTFSSSKASTTDNTDGVRFRGSQPTSTSNSTQPPPTLTNPPQEIPTQQLYQQQFHQQAWNQQYQMQMQQYYMQMQQYQYAMATGRWPYQPNMSGSQPVTHSSIPQTPISTSPANPPPQQDAHQQEQIPQQQQPAANQNVPMNAGPGGAIMQDDNDDENPANRDWLDWLYMSLRGLMLLSIIYFYSSTSRFILVTILGFIVYLYQAGWFTLRRHHIPEAPQQANQPVNENRNDVDGVAENTEQNAADENELNNENGAQQTPQTPNEPPPPGVFKILCTFVVSFVTSLVPAAPPVLQQN